MNAELPQTELRFSESLVNQQACYNMDVRTMKNSNSATYPRKISSTFTSAPLVEGKKILDYSPSFSHGHGKGRRMFASKSYFSLESLFLLAVLTASLLILPLILPPLPPPPFMLLLVPICILAVLMLLAFMPFKAGDVTYTYV